VVTFDVDWLRGMSVGVFSLQRAEVKDLTPMLDKLFGDKGNTPMAGLLRFIPIERTNSLVVISPQPTYLDEVRTWIDRIDHGGGNEPQLYVYDVRNVQASDLADDLSDVYGGGFGGGRSGDKGGKVGPGLSSGTPGGSDSVSGNRNGSGFGGGSSSNGGFTKSTGNGINGSASRFGSSGSPGGSHSGLADSGFGDDNNSHRSRSGAITTDEGVRITSVDSNNQLMVRFRPAQWADIEAIKRLDAVPLQVQIETRILEVALTGNFQFGVQWYLEGLVGTTNGQPTQPGNQQWWVIGGGGTSYVAGKSSFFYSFVNNDVSVALKAMETSGNAKTLSAPSLAVLNNQKAHIEVGDQIPFTQTYVNTGAHTDNTVGEVEYKDTGVILNVRPRVNPGGLVYLNINQVVSAPGEKDMATSNFPIQQREVATQVAVQSGQTVLLGGLITQDEGATDTGIPGVSRLPILGRLFGTTNRHRNRTELIVLFTPHVIANGDDAKQIMDDFQRELQGLRPYLRSRALHAAASQSPY
jgi:general secretion pathway protein D